MFALASVMRFAVFRCDVVRCGVCCGVARLTMREYPSFFRAAQSAVSIWLRVLSLNAPHHAYYKTFIKNNNSPLTREEVNMFEHILDEYKNGLGEIKNDEKALKEELSRVRFMYNFCYCFSSGFVLSFFVGGFIGYILKLKMNAYSFANIMAICMIALFVQWVIACAECISYEEMKFVEDELEKINNTVQPKPKKPSIRICNRNLVRRSVFGR